jgi:hypothetical protein
MSRPYTTLRKPYTLRDQEYDGQASLKHIVCKNQGAELHIDLNCYLISEDKLDIFSTKNTVELGYKELSGTIDMDICML